MLQIAYKDILPAYSNYNLYLLHLLVEKAVVSNTIRGSLINIFQLIGVLVLAAVLVEELFVMGVVVIVIFALGNICTVIPNWNSA